VGVKRDESNAKYASSSEIPHRDRISSEMAMLDAVGEGLLGATACAVGGWLLSGARATGGLAPAHPTAMSAAAKTQSEVDRYTEHFMSCVESK
jgi:hypothetical protein